MRRGRGTALVLCVVGLLLPSACGDDDSAGSAGSAPESSTAANLKGQLTIGAVLPLTGASATVGADQVRGLELAVEKVNSEGGVLGKKLVVKTEDSEGTAPSAVSAAKKLVSVDKVPVVIGEYSSGNTIPIGGYLQKQGVVLINPASSSPDIAKIGDFAFSTIGLDDVAGKFAADQLIELGKRNIALLGPNNAYGRGVLNAIEKNFVAAGGTIATKIFYTEGQPDYRQELQRIQDANPDALAYTAYGKEAQTINKEAFELGMDTHSFYGVYLTQNIADADPEATEGQIGMDVNYVGPNGAAYRRVYKEKFGFDFKSTFSGYTYDAVMLAAKAINDAKSEDPGAIRDALAKIGAQGYDGVTGEIKLDERGQRTEQPYIKAKVHENKLVPVD